MRGCDLSVPCGLPQRVAQSVLDADAPRSAKLDSFWAIRSVRRRRSMHTAPREVCGASRRTVGLWPASATDECTTRRTHVHRKTTRILRGCERTAANTPPTPPWPTLKKGDNSRPARALEGTA